MDFIIKVIFHYYFLKGKENKRLARKSINKGLLGLALKKATEYERKKSKSRSRSKKAQISSESEDYRSIGSKIATVSDL